MKTVVFWLETLVFTVIGVAVAFWFIDWWNLNTAPVPTVHITGLITFATWLAILLFTLIRAQQKR